MTKTELLKEALKLSPQEQWDLLGELRVAIVDDETISPAWRTEIRRRLDQLDRGEVAPLDGETALAELKASFPR